MNKFKKYLLYFSIFILSFFYISNLGSVNAATDFPRKADGTIDEESEMYKNGKIIRDVLQNYGLTDSAIYGIMSNLMVESGFDPRIVNKTAAAKNIGIAQWGQGANSRWSRLQAWTMSSDNNSGSKDYYNVSVQIGFLVYEARTNLKGAGWVPKWINWADFMQINDPVTACEFFQVCFERGVHSSKHSKNEDGSCKSCQYLQSEEVYTATGFKKNTSEALYQGMDARRSCISKLVEAYDGKEGTKYDLDGGGGGISNETDTGNYAKKGSLWSEGALGVTITDWHDSPIDLPSSESLDLEDRVKIANWLNTIKGEEESGIIRTLRSIVAFVGILIVIYSSLIYIAYWFDRINNFIELSALSILTFGRLEISPDDTVSTFSPKTKGKKVITHRDAVFISLLGIAFGVVLLSGVIYSLVMLILRSIKWLLRI